MATLTEVSYYTRKGVKYGAIGLVVILLAPVIWKGIKAIYLKIHPSPPPSPTVAYGRLPQLYFPAPLSAYQPVLRLETIDGKLPKVATVAKTYVVEINKSRLLALDRVKNQAKSLGFVNEPEQIDEQTYKFTHPVIPTTLTVDVIYNTYQYRYDWTLDQALYSAQAVPNNDQAFLESKAFWQTLGLLPSDLASGTPRFSYFAAQPPQMIPTISLSQANFVRVDMFRSDLDKLPVVTTGNESPVNVLFSGISDRTKRVVEADYSYSNIVDGGFATYPLKTVDQAWNELQQSKGYVARSGAGQVTVRKVYLAYYESSKPQAFLQPVFVFEGDGGYMAYVSAIDPQYQLEQPVPTSSPNIPSQ